MHPVSSAGLNPFAPLQPLSGARADTYVCSNHKWAVITVVHGTTLSAALTIYERGFRFSKEGRAVPSGVTVPASSAGVVCCGATVETALMFAKKEAQSHGALVIAAARPSPEHFALSACTGGTVVAFDSAAQTGRFVVLAVLRLQQSVPRRQVTQRLLRGRSSSNKAEWEQADAFLSEFEALLMHTDAGPAGWRLDARYTWRHGQRSRTAHV